MVFNTPGANANAVKELVVCALLLASRKVVQGANWVKSLAGTPDIGPAAEKGKATYAGPEIAGKKLGIIGLGAIGVKVANAAVGLDMEVWGYDPYLSVDGALALSVRSSTLPSWMRSSQTAIISPSMCRSTTKPATPSARKPSPR